VGFENKVEMEALNLWSEAFFEYLSLGQNVYQACYNAATQFGNSTNGIVSFKVAGLQAQTFN
jgi:hypothetical protein